jgi:hypothetical protein
MPGSTKRSYKAGKEIAKAIIEMVHLMYQNNTAAHFYRGLSEEIDKEMNRRSLKKEIVNSKE